MDGVAFPTVGSLVIVFQVRNSVRPMHLSVTTAIMITTSNSPIKWGAGYPINYSVTQGSVTPASSRGTEPDRRWSRTTVRKDNPTATLQATRGQMGSIARSRDVEPLRSEFTGLSFLTVVAPVPVS